MFQSKLTLESLTVESFETSDDEIVTPASPDTFATTGGPYLCAVDCGSASECHNC